MPNITLEYQTSKEQPDYPFFLLDVFERTGFSKLKAIHCTHAWHADIVFGENSGVYGIVGQLNQCYDARLMLRCVVDEPMPKPQFDAVTRLLLELPMFDKVVRGLDSVRRT